MEILEFLYITYSRKFLLILIKKTSIFLSLGTQKNQTNTQGAIAHVRPVRRATGIRNVRHRMQGNAHHQSHEESNREIDENNEDVDDKVELPDHKIGTKKRAKLAAKAEKKLQREAAERSREERKKQEELLQKEKDKQTEREHAEQLRQEEAEKKIREEKEKKDYEEYLKMKEAFNIEEEGYEQENKEYEEDLLQKFLAYIKENKVLVLEDLAAHFGLKTTSVIERIQDLKADGNLTGVIDDRGKFIYVSEDELHTIATFVQQRGRISITELAENSNNLINLTPIKSYTVSVN